MSNKWGAVQFSISDGIFLHQFDDLSDFFGDLSVAFTLMGPEALGAVFDAIICIGKIAAAVFAQGIEGTVAEDAGEGLWVGVLMAGKIFAEFVLEKVVICHTITSFELVPGEFVRGRGASIIPKPAKS